MITIAHINSLASESFTALFGSIAEHSPFVATNAAKARPYIDHAALVDAFQSALCTASEEQQLAVLRAHPSLAGKAALAGDLLPDSTNEQKGAGLDTLTSAEFARFTHLNNAYEQRFGFPFIFAVKGADKHMILNAFEQRIHNTMREEFLTALTQVCRIMRFRLTDKVAP